jgi:hypothetical protein
LDHVIELKEGTSEEGRGGVSFGRTNNIWLNVSKI